MKKQKQVLVGIITLAILVGVIYFLPEHYLEQGSTLNVYKNENLGYQIKYPENFEIKYESDSKLAIGEKTDSLHYRSLQVEILSNLSLEEYLAKQELEDIKFNSNVLVSEPRTINGIESYYIAKDSPIGLFYEYYIIEKQGALYVVSFDFEEKLLVDIANTFEFI